MNWLVTSALVAALAVVGALGACEPGTEVGPCVCFEDALLNLAVECSNVVNGSDITTALEEIQVASVSSLDIRNSPGLLNMPDDAFGETAISHIRFQNTGLRSLSASVFSGPTSQSLLSLYLKYDPSFTSLSSELLAGLPMLEELYVSSTGITALTDPLPDTALQYLDLTRNKIDQIADNYFADASSLSVVLLAFNSLTTEALTGSTQTFIAPNQDLYLDLGYNSISYGLDEVTFPAAVPRELILSGNGISNLTESAFAGLLDAMNEQYEGLEPYILLDNNPLLCGCELSWLASHPNRAVVQAAQCNNGQLVDNLGPADFTDC